MKPPRIDLGRPLARRAFTLMELLMVIAIVALLAALIVSSLSKAKSKARALQCLNNLKQWNLAMALYIDDADGLIPREGFGRDGRVRPDNWAQVRDQLSRDVWYNALPPYLDELPARAYFSNLTGQRPRFYENRVFHCPSARFPAGVVAYGEPFFSLAMNSKLIQPPIASSASIPVAAIQHPANTPTFLDARVSVDEVKVHSLQWDIDLGQPSIFATRFAARHNQGGNLAFADGHVSWRPGRSVVQTTAGERRGFAIFPDGDISWCPDRLTNPNTPD